MSDELPLLQENQMVIESVNKELQERFSLVSNNSHYVLAKWEPQMMTSRPVDIQIDNMQTNLVATTLLETHSLPLDEV